LEALSQRRKEAKKRDDADAPESEDEGAGDESKIETHSIAVADKSTKGAREAKGEDDDVEDAALQADPEAKKVRDWRHKLQKAFLSKAGAIVSEMPAADQVFKAAEDYQGYTIEYLQFSKIGKLMRKIATAPDIPRDDEFNFRQRAQALVTRWQDQLQGNAASASSAGPKTNGDVVPSTTEQVDVEMKDAPAPAVNGTEKPAESAPPVEAPSIEVAPAPAAATEVSA